MSNCQDDEERIETFEANKVSYEDFVKDPLKIIRN